MSFQPEYVRTTPFVQRPHPPSAGRCFQTSILLRETVEKLFYLNISPDQSCVKAFQWLLVRNGFPDIDLTAGATIIYGTPRMDS